MVVKTVESLSAHNITFENLVVSCFCRTRSYLNTIIPEYERNGLNKLRTLMNYLNFYSCLSNKFIMSINGVVFKWNTAFKAPLSIRLYDRWFSWPSLVPALEKWTSWKQFIPYKLAYITLLSLSFNVLLFWNLCIPKKLPFFYFFFRSR